MDIIFSSPGDFEIQKFSSRQQFQIEKKLFTPSSLSYTLLRSILVMSGAKRTKVHPSIENGGEVDIKGGQVVAF